MIFSNLFSCQNNEKTPEDKFWKWFLSKEKYIFDNADNLKVRETIYDDISSELQKLMKT